MEEEAMDASGSCTAAIINPDFADLAGLPTL